MYILKQNIDNRHSRRHVMSRELEIEKIYEKVKEIYEKVKELGIESKLEELYHMLDIARLVENDYYLSLFINRYCNIELTYDNCIRIYYINPLEHYRIEIGKYDKLTGNELKNAICKFVRSEEFINDVANTFLEVIRDLSRELYEGIKTVRQYIEQSSSSEGEDC